MKAWIVQIEPGIYLRSMPHSSGYIGVTTSQANALMFNFLADAYRCINALIDSYHRENAKVIDK